MSDQRLLFASNLHCAYARLWSLWPSPVLRLVLVLLFRSSKLLNVCLALVRRGGGTARTTFHVIHSNALSFTIHSLSSDSSKVRNARRVTQRIPFTPNIPGYCMICSLCGCSNAKPGLSGEYLLSLVIFHNRFDSYWRWYNGVVGNSLPHYEPEG